MVPTFYRKGQASTSRKALAMLGIWLAILAAALDLLVVALAGPSSHLRPYTKALPAFILAVTVLTRRRSGSRSLAAGLFAASLGDVTLVQAGDTAFLVGMLFFAAMHLCYIGAFVARGARLSATWWKSGLPYGLGFLTLTTDITLDPHAGPFAIPLTAYSILLTAMVYGALSLVGQIEKRASYLIGSGALIFMSSDTALAFAKFWPGVRFSPTAEELTIVGAYFVAQILIASGMLNAPTESRPT